MSDKKHAKTQIQETAISLNLSEKVTECFLWALIPRCLFPSAQDRNNCPCEMLQLQTKSNSHLHKPQIVKLCVKMTF